MGSLTCVLVTVVLLFSANIEVQGRRQLTDTSDGFHFGLIFDTPILNDWLENKTINSMPYNFVWGASDALVQMYKSTNPFIMLSKYIAWARDTERHSLEWWKKNHPDWLVYECDKKTVATIPTEPELSLDITNPAVIDWQVKQIAEPASKMGFHYIAADNFALGNAVGSCGVWKDGVWVQKYSGQWADPQYAKDALNWLKEFRSRLQDLDRPMKLGINFVIGGYDLHTYPITDLTDSVDLILDEAGVTKWGGGKPTQEGWLRIAEFVELLQEKGHAYFGINQFAVLDHAAKEWAFSSYLMSKNQASGVTVCTIQGYGRESLIAEYAKLNVGTPLGPRYLSNGIYWRDYSSGLAITNPSSSSVTVTINSKKK